MRRAFVSHSTADDRYVAEMESFLRAAGFDDVFNDVRSIPPGAEFWPAIEQGIAAADTLVVVITAASNDSAWVQREVEYALSLSRKLIPVWIEDCPVPAFLKNRDVIDFRPRTREARRIDISRIIRYAPAELIGRDDEKKLLSEAWAKTLRGEAGRPAVVTFVALGGEGKTSLVAKWAVDEMLAQGWPGCDAAFAWSFYSQGTREQLAASSDLFLKEALTFFATGTKEEIEEIKAFAASPAGAFEKGQRLARLVGQRRSLLILDGLEPLQYASTAPTPGELKDQGLAALLKGLAQNSHGLCVVTTRYSLPDLRAFWSVPPSPSGREAGAEGAAREVQLLRLSRDAGVHLLKTLGVREKSGTAQEFATLVEDVKGHALTLTLLGSYLRDAHGGDIRKRDLVKLEEADAQEQGGHAFRAVAAYVNWLASGAPQPPSASKGKDGWWSRLVGSSPATHEEGWKDRTTTKCAIEFLHLLGLFDRPAEADCLRALWTDFIPGLTEAVFSSTEVQRNIALRRLEDAKLLTVNRDASGALDSLDAHPHLREYFARQLRTQQPEAWRAAHRRLYEHLCATTQEGDQPTLEDLQPLYQAVAHGCQAGIYEEAYWEINTERINGGRSVFYSLHKLGAFSSDLGAVACFFNLPWKQLVDGLSPSAKRSLLATAAFELRAVGRLVEATEPMRASLALCVDEEVWLSAAKVASNLSELELTLGEVAGAVGDAEQSVTYADRSGDAFMRKTNTARLADALHQAGHRVEAETRFREAEQMQKEMQPDYPQLYTVSGFQYCDLLLAAPERAAWQICLGSARAPRAVSGALAGNIPGEPSALESSTRPDQPARAQVGAREGACAPLLESCRAVSQRAAQTLKWAEQNRVDILSASLDHLTLGRAALYAAILEGRAGCPQPAEDNPTHPSPSRRGEDTAPYLETARRELDLAVDGLRRSGNMDDLPRGLLTRAWLRFLTGARTGPESAQADLDEAWEIAERGPMPLFLADIHLHRARLFGLAIADSRLPIAAAKYPWQSPAHDLAEARRLISHHGYLRRQPELEDAEHALLPRP